MGFNLAFKGLNQVAMKCLFENYCIIVVTFLQILKKSVKQYLDLKNVYLSSLMMKVQNHVYVLG
jgi:hypothetical protein